MASLNLTVEDCSPLITYDPAGAWSDSSLDDPLLPAYSGRSYHSTSTKGATATIDFHGTGLTILGGKRPNYGRFMVSVDGTMTLDGTSNASQDAVGQTLGTISRLPPGKHRVVIENVDGSPIDIDSLIITDEAKMDSKFIDDTDPVLTYTPSPAGWGTNRLPTFQGGTIHFSQDPSASASMQFTGDGIALWGTISPDHADMKVTVDKETVILKGGSNGGVNQLHSQVLLYYQSNLGAGTHSLTFAAESPNANAPFIDLDSVVVFSAIAATSNDTSTAPSPNGTGLSSGTNPSSTAPSAGSSASGSLNRDGLSKGVLIGAIVAGSVGLLSCIAICFFILRCRRRRMKEKYNTANGKFGRRPDSPMSPTLPMQQEPKRMEAGRVISGPLDSSVFVLPPPKAKLFPVTAPKSISDSSRHSIAPSYYSSPESGRSRISLTSASSASPLLRPAGLPRRTVPAKTFRNGASPPFPLPPIPRMQAQPYSPSASSSASSQNWRIYQGDPEGQRYPGRPVQRPTPMDYNRLRV